MVLFTPGPGNLVSIFRYFILGPHVQTWKDSLYIDQIVSLVAHAVLGIAVIDSGIVHYRIEPRDWESLAF